MIDINISTTEYHINEKDVSQLILCNIKEFQSNVKSEITDDVKTDFGNCKICQDKASGNHYGIPSCEGCKGFFKRSVHKYRSYVCHYQNKCVITPKLRNKCKYCRWKACLSSGMSFDSIRLGRISNVDKKKLMPEKRFYVESKDKLKNIKEFTKSYFLSTKYLVKLNNLSKFDSIETSKLMAKTLFVDYYLNTSNENHLFVFAMLRDKLYQLYKEETAEFNTQYEKALKLIQSGHKAKYDFNQDLIKLIWQKGLVMLSKHAKSLTKLIKHIPGFDKLNYKDQTIILKQHFFTIIGIKISKLFINDECYLMSDQDILLNKEVITRIFGANLCEQIFQNQLNLCKFRLTDQELALTIPLVLSWQSFNLNNSDLLKEINQYYARSLEYEFNLNKRSEEFIQNFVKAIVNAHYVNKMCRDVEIEFSIVPNSF